MADSVAVEPRTPQGAATEPARGSHRSTHRPRREAWAAYLFLAPWFVGLLVITIGPIFASLYLSFTDYSLLEEAKWIGLDNYVKMFTQDERFLASLKVTTVYVV